MLGAMANRPSLGYRLLCRWLRWFFRTLYLLEVKGLIANPATDLFARIPHGTGQTILREALLVADHNAYHLGVLIAIQRMLKK